MMRLVIGLSLLAVSQTSVAQFIVKAGTTIAFNQNPDIVIETTGDINTNSATDFAGAKLQVNLIGDNQGITGNVFVTSLRLKIGTGKSINNTLTISEGIEFTSGILKSGNSGKILFIGDGSNITGGSTASYVEGPFYQLGGGYRFFPLGTGGVYSPATFENSGIGSSDEMSVEVIAGDPGLTFRPEVITSIDNSRYWQIETPDVSTVNTRVSLGLNGAQDVGGSFAVVQASSTGSEAENLGFSFLNDTEVTSRSPVTNAILAVGVIPEIVVKVHDVITPFLADGANDKLTIDQIDQFDFNTVTVLDRWGVVVKRWENFTNDIDYDFSKLSPGNYIVIVEFGNLSEGSAMEKISQMVTVLKTN